MEHLPGWLSGSLIFLGAAVVAVPLSRALGLGAIIGYLAAGVAIGPWGLGLVSRVDEVLHFAEFGVVLMLFLVGLELEPRRLWQLRRPIFAWGTAQVLACAGALALLAVALGVPWRTAVVAGLGLALSSTAIALQVMSERNLTATATGQGALAILLFQDIAAIPILALVPLLGSVSHDSAPPGSVWTEALRIVVLVGGIIIAGRLLLRPLLRWIARSDTPEIFTAAALLLVVAISALMQLTGLSMALGAFLAGVLLAESEYRRALETDIEPFKGLLLGLFFMAVGMGIDFAVLARSPWLMLGLVLGFIAVKCVLIAGLAAVLRLPLQERPVFALLLAQGGEFAFVVFQAAAGAGVFEPQTASLLVGAVAFSMLLSPLALVAVDRWVLPRFADCGPKASAEEIAEPQDAPVIILGFGRYGQIVGRLLLARGTRCTVLDHDVEMIEAARQFGYRVFYGDATRLDLLRTAGAAHARVLVVAVDDVEQSLQIVHMARAEFPHLTVVARAHDVPHWNRLRQAGVAHIERELFESSLVSGRAVLELLGDAPEQAGAFTERFRAHNRDLLEQMHPHFEDRARLIAVAKEARRQFEEQMRNEQATGAFSRLPPPPPDPASALDPTPASPSTAT